jgi:hypothetical protein
MVDARTAGISVDGARRARAGRPDALPERRPAAGTLRTALARPAARTIAPVSPRRVLRRAHLARRPIAPPVATVVAPVTSVGRSLGLLGRPGAVEQLLQLVERVGAHRAARARA